jgi:mannose-1-phosphate guanylyltransferase
MRINSVIMAGGSGSRLWPISRSGYPKQFLKIHGDQTMYQSTIERLNNININSTITICNDDHRFFVSEQLKQINKESSIILEPFGRNTAPALTLAALTLADDVDENIMLILPADHVIQNEINFTEALNKAIQIAESGQFVTFGIVPKSPHTGYGYIKQGKKIGDGYKIESFVEKPNVSDAKKFISSGKYYWNSGMFVFKASSFLDEMKKFNIEIYESCKKSIEKSSSDLGFTRIDEKEFAKCPSDSIDYALMEKTENAVVIPLDAGWSDIGSWSSLWEVSEKDADGNTTYGNVIARNCENSYVRSDDEKLVVSLGVKDTIVVSTKDVIMVANSEQAEEIKIITEGLKKESREVTELHREVYRPWGKYDSIDQGNGYQVKRITVNPGAKLSLQKHHHRSEHWVVVSGVAKVTNGDETFLLKKNESTYIPVGSIHSLENPTEDYLELIEVQSGSYLGEDDIVRFEDNYGRA